MPQLYIKLYDVSKYHIINTKRKNSLQRFHVVRLFLDIFIFLILTKHNNLILVPYVAGFCETGWIRYSPDETCLKFIEDAKLTYSGAESECKTKYGGVIATVETETKNYFVRGILAQVGKL